MSFCWTLESIFTQNKDCRFGPPFLAFSPACVNDVLLLCLLHVCVVCPLPGLHGRRVVVWLRSVWRHLKKYNVLPDPYSSYVFNLSMLFLILIVQTVILHSSACVSSLECTCICFLLVISQSLLWLFVCGWITTKWLQMCSLTNEKCHRALCFSDLSCFLQVVHKKMSNL